MVRLGWRSVDNPGVNEALTHEVIHSWVQIKTVQISGDAATLILKHTNMSSLLKVRDLWMRHNIKMKSKSTAK